MLENVSGPTTAPMAASQPMVAQEALDAVIPEDPRAAYDVKEVITRLVDDGVFLEYMREFAPNLVCGFAHLGGMAVGGNLREVPCDRLSGAHRLVIAGPSSRARPSDPRRGARSAWC